MSLSLADQLRVALDPDEIHPELSEADLIVLSLSKDPTESLHDRIRLILDPDIEHPELSIMDLCFDNLEMLLLVQGLL